MIYHNNREEKSMDMRFPGYVPVTGTVQDVTNMRDCCFVMVSVLASNNEIVNLVINEDTLVVDNKRLRRGMIIRGFYDASRPVILIYPPQYQAVAVVVLREENEGVVLAYFNRHLTANDNSLRLNIGRNTVVETVNGQLYKCDPANHVLLVFYGATTRSIPPQTTPDRIIVFC